MTSTVKPEPVTPTIRSQDVIDVRNFDGSTFRATALMTSRYLGVTSVDYITHPVDGEPARLGSVQIEKVTLVTKREDREDQS